MQKIILMAKRLVSKVVGRGKEEEPAPEDITRQRLQQANARKAAHTQEIIKRVELQAEDDLRRRMEDTTQEVSLEALNHWTKNPDRYVRQHVRSTEEMGGVGHSFEIDPVRKLPGEHDRKSRRY